MIENDSSQMRHFLNDLIQEHRTIDELIHMAIDNHLYTDALKIQRMKKRKLQLKDQIAKLESSLIPDLDA